MIFNSEITVDQGDRWMFRNNEISQQDILDYFKKNLLEDEKGILIKNTFRQLTESGYIQADGFPLHIIDVLIEQSDLKFTTDSGEILSIRDVGLYRGRDESLFLMKCQSRFLKYRFSRKALSSLADSIVENETGFAVMIHGKEIPFQDYNFPVQVDLPSD